MSGPEAIEPEETGDARLSGPEVRSRTAAGVVTVGLRNVAVRAIGLLGSVFLARLLAPEDFGLLALGLALTTVGAYLASGGFGAALISREEAPTGHVLGVVLGFQLAIALAIAMGATAVGYVISEKAMVLSLMAASLPIDAFRVPNAIVLQRALQFQVLARVDVLEVVSFNLMAVGLAYAGLGVWGVALATALRPIIGVSFLIATGPIRWIRPRVDVPTVREIWRFGFTFQAAGLAIMARDHGVNVVVAAVGGLATLGIWALAFRLLQVILFFFQALWRVSFPAMARLLESGEDPKPLLRRAIALGAVATGILVTAIAGPAPALVPALFGHRWDAAISVVCWGAAALMISGPLSTSLSGYFYAIGRADVVLWNAAVQALIWPATCAALVPALDATAVGIGMLASSAAAVTVLTFFLRRHVPMPVLPMLITPCLAAAAASTAGYQLASEVDNSWVGLGAALAVSLSLFLAIMRVTHRAELRDLLSITARALRVASGRRAY